MNETPSDRLTEDHVEWVIDGHRRSHRITSAYRIVIKVAIWLFKALKWLGDSLKWAAPLALMFWTAYQAGMFQALKQFYG